MKLTYLVVFLITLISCKGGGKSPVPNKKQFENAVSIANDLHTIIHDVPETIGDINQLVFSVNDQGDKTDNGNVVVILYNNEQKSIADSIASKLQSKNKYIDLSPSLAAFMLKGSESKPLSNATEQDSSDTYISKYNVAKGNYVKYKKEIAIRDNLIRDVEKTRTHKLININNSTTSKLSISIAYWDMFGCFVVEGWFNVNPGQTKTLPIFTRNEEICFHAESNLGNVIVKDTSNIYVAPVDENRDNRFFYMENAQNNLFFECFPFLAKEDVIWQKMRMDFQNSQFTIICNAGNLLPSELASFYTKSMIPDYGSPRSHAIRSKYRYFHMISPTWSESR